MIELPISGYPNYFAGSDGHIYSYRPLGGSDKVRRHRVGAAIEDGYRRATLKDSKGKYKRKCVHVWIALAFLGPKPFAGAMVLHGDGKRSNCKPENLRWGSHQENIDDSMKHGTHSYISGHPNAKLTKSQVKSIRKKWDSVESKRGLIKKLAAKYNVSDSTISRTVHVKNWLRI